MGFPNDRTLDVLGAGLLLVIVVTTALLVSAASDIGSQPTPDDAWSLTQVNGTVVEIAREPNETVGPSELVVTVDGTEREVQWSGSPADGLVGRLEVGDATIVKLYRMPEGKERDRIAHWWLDERRGRTDAPSRVR